VSRRLGHADVQTTLKALLAEGGLRLGEALGSLPCFSIKIRQSP
jgi:hypothetical protein